MARGQPCGEAPSVTIWNLTPLTDFSWPNNQRLHQFLINQQNVTFGAVPLSIDENIDRGSNANKASESYPPDYAGDLPLLHSISAAGRKNRIHETAHT